MFHWLKRRLQRRTELTAGEAYRKWAPGYPPWAHNPLMELEERAVLEMLPDPRGCAVLDLACGSGRYLSLMKQRGASPVVGLDASVAMLGRARAISTNLIQADLLDLGLRSGRFHLVVCALAIGHVENIQRSMQEISRVLAPKGILIYSDLHPFGSWLGWQRTFQDADGHDYAVRQYVHSYEDHFKACQSAGLRIEAVREPKIDFDHSWRGFPALIVVRAGKAG